MRPETEEKPVSQVPALTDYYKDQLLRAVFQYMPMDMRGQIMRDCPQAYNAYHQREIVRVHKAV